MAGVALGHMNKVMFGTTLLVGVNGCIETYVSQAAGAQEFRAAGLYLLQGRILLVLFFIPIACFLLQTERLMLLVGQDAKVAENCQIFVTWSLPAVLISGLNDSQKKFLNCFRKNYVPMVTNIVNTLLYPFIAYYLVVSRDLGIKGVAITDVVSIGLTYACNLLYTSYVSELRETRVGFSVDLVRTSLREQLKLAGWSLLNCVVEVYAWQLLILLSGYLSVVVQAANSIIMNLVILFFALNVGMMHSSCTLIGQQIGKQDIRLAKHYLHS